ncbi:alpha/beta hydrolase [Enterobacter cancerogenus]|uniref:UilS family quorum-quenching N-acyl-homoserine lactonase n=1 Tax=Enterobacter cancerogenus TaxID=69218 RepID=UPI001CA39762|nr:alpha/beta hydrolase [Enterobacter cancerogenus]QZY35327.1 alpha/beta hydrolase [Enterobacter cancerogenus]
MLLTKHKLKDDIAVTLRRPADSVKAPVVILCHGFCGIQEILLPRYAEAFTQAGFATITFDYRGFGENGGERGRLVPALQIEDICSVIDWAEAQSEIDGHRIALWGTSLGACHVFAAAVERPRIKGIISQMGFADGEAIVTGKMDEQEKQGFVATLDKMVEKRERLGKEMFVAITKVLGDEESKAFFEANKERYPSMDIKIPFLTVYETLNYKPYQNAEKVNCPTLVVVAGNDTVNEPQQGVALYDSVEADDKTLYVEEGAKHYDLYDGKHFDNVINQQLAWLKGRL